jgi:hypothetical protein
MFVPRNRIQALKPKFLTGVRGFYGIFRTKLYVDYYCSEENGEKKEAEGNYKNWKKEGLWVYWYENGNICKTKTYEDGVLVKEALVTTYKTL